MITLQQASTFNAASFVLNHGIKNENDVPLSFKYHKFLIRPYMDESPRIVARKASQVGFSTLAIIRALHLARYRDANIIYTLPSRSAVKDFVQPKVDPLINNNPVLRDMVGHTNSAALKSIGKRFIYYRGSWEADQAISISAHVLINDEVDRSKQISLKTYETRLDAAKVDAMLQDKPFLGWVWKFSNPSIPGNGVDEWWHESDQKHWMIKCSRCNQKQSLEWPDNVDLEKEIYICSKCKRELSNDDRIYGEWVPKRLGREISGYWYNQMMNPWVDAKEIIKKSKGDPAIFHNFTLGLPYLSKDDQVSRESIVRCCVPDHNPQTEVAMGVDQNARVKHYVIGNRHGIFRLGETESWDEIIRMRDMYNAHLVMDANPNPTMPIKISEKYPGKAYIHYYKENTQTQQIIEWGGKDKENTVYSDRTKIIDLLVAEINSQDLYFNMTHQELDRKMYITHWLNIYRTLEEDAKGIQRAVWRHLEYKPDDFVHATVYWRIALTLTLSTGQVITSQPDRETAIADPKTGNIADLDSIIQDAQTPESKGWKSI